MRYIKVALIGLLVFLSSQIQSEPIQTTFVITSLPQDTPLDASIYVTGDFTNWYPDVRENRLRRQANGTYLVTIEHELDTFEYKFTRGSWKSVEARSNGRARSNRTFVHDGTHQIIHLKIESWEDISRRGYLPYMYALILIALQGLLLLPFINTLGRKKSNRILSILILLISIVLLGRASTFDPDIFNWQPKLVLLPEIILFNYGPLLYLYMLNLFNLKKSKKWFSLYWFIPSVIHVLVLIPLLFYDNQTFIYRMIDRDLLHIFAGAGALALCWSVLFWIKLYQLKTSITTSHAESEFQAAGIVFYHAILYTHLIYLLLWALALTLFAVGNAYSPELIRLSEWLMDALWMMFSLIIFVITLFILKSPELFRLKKRYENQSIDMEEMVKVKSQLEKLLETEKIYRQSDLTLASLAYKIPTSTHTLSRVINETYNKSFSNLINDYRIRDFIEMVKNQSEESFLMLAYSVGFQSKATFNRSFKKVTGQSPREYFDH